MSDRIGLAPVRGSIVPEEVPPAAAPRSMHHRKGDATMTSFLYRLAITHRRLDDEIRREMKRRAPDSLRLLRLKKLKLMVKDRLHRQVYAKA
jgi:hypothetical protein